MIEHSETTINAYRNKLVKLMNSEEVICNDDFLDWCLDEKTPEIRSLPNSQQVGNQDKYVAWIGPARK